MYVLYVYIASKITWPYIYLSGLEQNNRQMMQLCHTSVPSLLSWLRLLDKILIICFISWLTSLKGISSCKAGWMSLFKVMWVHLLVANEVNLCQREAKFQKKTMSNKRRKKYKITMCGCVVHLHDNLLMWTFPMIKEVTPNKWIRHIFSF